MFRDNEVAFVYMYTKPVDAAKLILQKRKWRVWSGSIWRNWMPHCSRLEISDSAFPWRDSKSRNNGWRAENKG